MRALLFAALLAAVVVAHGARLHGEDGLRAGSETATISRASRKARKGGKDDGPTTYKNTKPLIGILTQPCHDCPGKVAARCAVQAVHLLQTPGRCPLRTPASPSAYP